MSQHAESNVWKRWKWKLTRTLENFVKTYYVQNRCPNIWQHVSRYSKCVWEYAFIPFCRTKIPHLTFFFSAGYDVHVVLCCVQLCVYIQILISFVPYYRFLFFYHSTVIWISVILTNYLSVNRKPMAFNNIHSILFIFKQIFFFVCF